VVETSDVWNIGQRSAMMGGSVLDDGGAPIKACGVCWSEFSGPTLSNNHVVLSVDSGNFMVEINSLLPGTPYYVRAYATNEAGTSYGNEVTFETGGYQAPLVSTDPVSYINSTSAVSGGFVYGDGGGNIISRGVCWSTSTDPTLDDPHTTDGTGTGQFSSRLEGLLSDTTYYIRAYAVNNTLTAYGNNVIFKTLPDSEAIIFHPILFNPDLTYGTVTDTDWNVYKTIQIGTQTWMAENLKTTTFINNGQIANGNDYLTWENYTLDLYCWYNTDTSYMRNYGLLYNWYAVNTGMLCPSGWHVPSAAEFTTLITSLGGEIVAGGKLKETGTTHWLTPNAEADNGSGFTALPGGYRSASDFMSMGSGGYWWSSTESSSGEASIIFIRSDNASVTTTDVAKSNGISVRCIKD